ncbi:methyl-accepting chemotaxis protein [Alkalicoccus urumqiensis]|uniref:Methyl-accepting transducer domain-containing protein n=1 Tax=Alkalicoccus urumqiensis TaxID=1548213 RepID=A0A2P6MJB6_ALKUR|nr:methyl-accepting chemotaxis protein [Alkalicoccus urumqiensis]PRO66353.1 hypothetical protein C6I21_05995 [Alkalicoccus urumqiensis]
MVENVRSIIEELRQKQKPLVHLDPWMTNAEVDSWMKKHPAECYVVEEPYHLQGYMMAGDFFEKMGSRFGFSLYGERPVHEQLKKQPLVLPEEMLPEEMTRHVLARTEENRFDAVFIRRGDVLTGFLQIPDLLELTAFAQREVETKRLSQLREAAQHTEAMETSISSVQERASRGVEAMTALHAKAEAGRSQLDRLIQQAEEQRQKEDVQAEVVKHLHDRAATVAEVVGMIEAITEKITILSLNAAIEAARAGAEGRGFAVVAGEIRQLADTTKEAAGRITSEMAKTTEAVASTAEGQQESAALFQTIAETLMGMNDAFTALQQDIDDGGRQWAETAAEAAHAYRSVTASSRYLASLRGKEASDAVARGTYVSSEAVHG